MGKWQGEGSHKRMACGGGWAVVNWIWTWTWDAHQGASAQSQPWRPGCGDRVWPGSVLVRRACVCVCMCLAGGEGRVPRHTHVCMCSRVCSRMTPGAEARFTRVAVILPSAKFCHVWSDLSRDPPRPPSLEEAPGWRPLPPPPPPTF